MSNNANKQEQSINQIAELLEHNPDIFQQQPHLLELINLTDNRGTASLLERQLDTLKQRLQQQQSQQHDLLTTARENEQISDTFSSITCQLIGFTKLSQFSDDLPTALKQNFTVDAVTFKTTHSMQGSAPGHDAYQEILRRIHNQHTLCDNRLPKSIMDLLFDESIKSAALIPLLIPQTGNANNEIIGVLALGSIEQSRYHPDLGTAHLDRLGLMAGICLHRLQNESPQ